MYHLSRRSNLAIALISMKKEQLSNLHPFTSIYIHQIQISSMSSSSSSFSHHLYLSSFFPSICSPPKKNSHPIAFPHCSSSFPRFSHPKKIWTRKNLSPEDFSENNPKWTLHHLLFSIKIMFILYFFTMFIMIIMFPS